MTTPFDVLVEEMKQGAQEYMAIASIGCSSNECFNANLETLITHTAHAVREATVKETHKDWIKEGRRLERTEILRTIKKIKTPHVFCEDQRVQADFLTGYQQAKTELLATLSTKDTPTNNVSQSDLYGHTTT